MQRKKEKWFITKFFYYVFRFMTLEMKLFQLHFSFQIFWIIDYQFQSYLSVYFE